MILIISLLCAGVFGQTFASAIPKQAAECLNEHNKLRARHGAPPLKWDPVLAQNAQKWADNLRYQEAKYGRVIRMHSRTREGENVFWASNPTCKEALEDWYDEYCDYANDGYCSNPPKNPPRYVLHFTQIVWKKTVMMGLGIAGDFVVIRYSPKGNSYRHYATNVKCASKSFTDNYCFY